MEPPKCRLCGNKHWGGCIIQTTEPRPSKTASKKKSKSPEKKERRAWLSKHPDRSVEWLANRLADGFHIHHMDGDYKNDVPGNLLLIEGKDHQSLHGKTVPKVFRESDAQFNRKEYQRKYMRDYMRKRRENEGLK